VTRAGALLLAVLLAIPAGAQPAAPALTVTYRSDTSVYVSGGRAQGLGVGERLTVVEGRATVAELEVVFVAENSASCRVVRQSRAVRKGDRVLRAAGTGLASPRPSPTPAPPLVEDGVAGARPAPVPTPPPTGRPAPFARFTGALSVGYAGAHDGSEADRDVSEQYGRFELGLRDIAGSSAASFRARGSIRDVSRAGRGLAAPVEERRDRLYEAALAWQRPDGRYSVQAGRVGATPFAGVGYLDGVLGEIRPTESLGLGGFLGRDPNVEDVPGFDGGSRLGAFVRLAPRAVRLPYELVAFGVREHAGGDVSREYVGVEGQLRSGRVWLHGRTEVDLNRGWRAERASSPTQLSDLRATATWRLSPERTFSLSYDRHEGYWYRGNRELADVMVPAGARQGVRATLAATPRQGWAAWGGGSARLTETAERTSWAVFGGVRNPDLLGLVAGVDASWAQTLFTQGFQATARAGRNLSGGHRLDLSYTVDRYDVVDAGDTRLSQWLRLTGYGQLGRQAYVQADVEYAAGDDFEGPRLLLEAGWRF
jgi:hypothetical protein